MLHRTDAAAPPWGNQALHAAVIDLDGTLVDTVGDFQAALALTLADLGRPPVSRDFVLRTVGKGSEYLLLQTLAQVGAPASDYELAWARYQHHYRGLNGRHSAVFPGVPEGLALLQARGWKLACLTNKPGEFARELLAAKGLASCFSVVFGGDAFEHKKPHPLPVLRSCEALGAAPAHTLVVGDSANDAAAARAAGCPVVLVSYGYNHGQPAASAGPDAVLDRLDELARWLPG